MARQEVNILIFNFKPERKNSIYLNASHGQISSHKWSSLIINTGSRYLQFLSINNNKKKFIVWINAINRISVNHRALIEILFQLVEFGNK